MHISIILPFPVTKPVGGAKIMYEYANRLAANGHTVNIFHSIKRPFKKSNTPLWFKRASFALRGVARPKWFPLNPQIKAVIVPSITDKYIPDADIVMCTWWQMAYAINELSAGKGKKFNLIQDFEIWKGQEDKVKESYCLPIHHIVIARYLQKLVFETSGKQPVLIPNAIDEKIFFVEVPPEKRNTQSIIMLYSQEPRKGTSFGLEVLKKVKENFADLNVIFFGVFSTPADLPDWITYYQSPSNLLQLYNNSAIFISPSLGEGWALPPAEAMACGCAVVCTNIGGHQDYAIPGETALLAEPKNVEDMKDKIESLLTDNKKRIELAYKASRLMSNQFSWKTSVQKLEEYFFDSLKN